MSRQVEALCSNIWKGKSFRGLPQSGANRKKGSKAFYGVRGKDLNRQVLIAFSG
jgi:hypothetical protein